MVQHYNTNLTHFYTHFTTFMLQDEHFVANNLTYFVSLSNQKLKRTISLFLSTFMRARKQEVEEVNHYFVNRNITGPTIKILCLKYSQFQTLNTYLNIQHTNITEYLLYNLKFNTQ